MGGRSSARYGLCGHAPGGARPIALLEPHVLKSAIIGYGEILSQHRDRSGTVKALCLVDTGSSAYRKLLTLARAGGRRSRHEYDETRQPLTEKRAIPPTLRGHA